LDNDPQNLRKLTKCRNNTMILLVAKLFVFLTTICEISD